MCKIKMIKVVSFVVAVIFIHAGVAFADSIDGLSVDPNGNVGIGTSTPQSLLHIESAAELEDMIASGIKFKNTLFSSNAHIYLGYFPLFGGFDFLGLGVNDALELTIFDTGDAILTGELTENSDISLKENIREIDTALEKITKLRGVTYEWKDKEKRGDKCHIGLIAQEVEEVFPEAVSKDPEGNKGVAYSRLVAPLIEAVKTLKAENDNLASEIENLKIRIVALENK